MGPLSTNFWGATSLLNPARRSRPSPYTLGQYQKAEATYRRGAVRREDGERSPYSVTPPRASLALPGLPRRASDEGNSRTTNKTPLLLLKFERTVEADGAARLWHVKGGQGHGHQLSRFTVWLSGSSPRGCWHQGGGEEMSQHGPTEYRYEILCY